MELASSTGDWQAVKLNAERMLAVNPLIPEPHRRLAQAAEKLGDASQAVVAYHALLQFDTADAVDVHYRLAQLLQQQGDPTAARREVLMALEDAPRFLAAHRLLLELPANPDPPPNGSK